jgi:hypothetical protein
MYVLSSIFIYMYVVHECMFVCAHVYVAVIVTSCDGALDCMFEYLIFLYTEFLHSVCIANHILVNLGHAQELFYSLVIHKCIAYTCVIHKCMAYADERNTSFSSHSHST